MRIESSSHTQEDTTLVPPLTPEGTYDPLEKYEELINRVAGYLVSRLPTATDLRYGLHILLKEQRGSWFMNLGAIHASELRDAQKKLWTEAYVALLSRVRAAVLSSTKYQKLVSDVSTKYKIDLIHTPSEMSKLFSNWAAGHDDPNSVLITFTLTVTDIPQNTVDNQIEASANV